MTKIMFFIIALALPNGVVGQDFCTNMDGTVVNNVLCTCTARPYDEANPIGMCPAGSTCTAVDGRCRKGGYVLMDQKAAACAAGTTAIASEGDCDTARAAIGLSGTVSSESESGYPSGCYMDFAYDVLFNTHPSGQNFDESNSPICEEAACANKDGTQANADPCYCGTDHCIAGALCTEASAEGSECEVPCAIDDGSGVNDNACKCDGTDDCPAGKLCDSSESDGSKCKEPLCEHPDLPTGYIGSLDGVLTPDDNFAPTGASCDTASGYTGAVEYTVCTGGGEYTLSGCLATCVHPDPLPAGYTGSPTGTLTIDGFSVQGIMCASGYVGSATAAACAGANDEYSLSGCEATCVHPSPLPAGYTGNPTGTLTVAGFDVSGLMCASGYVGSPETTVCQGAGQPYIIDGCEATCIHPERLPRGYVGTPAGTITQSAFDPSGLSCGNGYVGTVIYIVCDAPGGEYKLSGCANEDRCGPREDSDWSKPKCIVKCDGGYEKTCSSKCKAKCNTRCRCTNHKCNDDVEWSAIKPRGLKGTTCKGIANTISRARQKKMCRKLKGNGRNGSKNKLARTACPVACGLCRPRRRLALV